jgi:hypothetical protein
LKAAQPARLPAMTRMTTAKEEIRIVSSIRPIAPYTLIASGTRILLPRQCFGATAPIRVC